MTIADRITVWAAVAAGLIFLSIIGYGIAHGAEVCKTPAQLHAALDKAEGVALYPFEGEDAAKLQGELEQWRGTPYDFKSALIDVVLWLADGTVSFYVFDADLCGQTEFIFEKGIAADIMQRSGVAAPFGPTFYKLPNAPGTRI